MSDNGLLPYEAAEAIVAIAKAEVLGFRAESAPRAVDWVHDYRVMEVSSETGLIENPYLIKVAFEAALYVLRHQANEL